MYTVTKRPHYWISFFVKMRAGKARSWPSIESNIRITVVIPILEPFQGFEHKFNQLIMLLRDICFGKTDLARSEEADLELDSSFRQSAKVSA